MKNAKRIMSILLVTSILFSVLMLLSACDAPAARIPDSYTFVPGPAFATNINDVDPRRQVRCSIIFEVVDEAAIIELTDHVYVVRDAVIKELGKLTMDELTTEKDLEDIAERLVFSVNDALKSNIDLIIGVYFTDFSVG